MLLGAGTSHKLQVNISAAGDLRFSGSKYVASSATPPVVDGSNTIPILLASITGTGDQDLVAGVASTGTRIDEFTLFNNSGSVAPTLQFKRTDGTTPVPGPRLVLLPNEWVTYSGGMWAHYDANMGLYGPAPTLDVLLAVSGSAVTNSTTSFADVTGLTYPIKAGKKYQFLAHLYHQTAATTTGSRFGVNGPASPTVLRAGQISAETPGIASSNIAVGVGTAYDTALSASTTGPGTTDTLAIVSGYIQPSADGTFAIRCASEVAASALTIQIGSWLRLREVSA